ncbi:hypothetical protein JXC34_03470, partial [Candidatus Woesearchaeota archaeon]|nr:hypothetical protein [Candidatus Woesearchaeota archaeon]
VYAYLGGSIQLEIDGQAFTVPRDNYDESIADVKETFGGFRLYYEMGSSKKKINLWIMKKIPNKQVIKIGETKDFLGRTFTLVQVNELEDNICKGEAVLFTKGDCIDYCVPTCGDDKCYFRESENSTFFDMYNFCADDCESLCGNSLCDETDIENDCEDECSEDLCGDEICDSFEKRVCEQDCGDCGDKECEYSLNEDTYCYEDCGSKKLLKGVNHLYPGQKIPVNSKYSMEFTNFHGGQMKRNFLYEQSLKLTLYVGDTKEITYSLSPEYAISLSGYDDYYLYLKGTSENYYADVLAFSIQEFNENSILSSGDAVIYGDYIMVLSPNYIIDGDDVSFDTQDMLLFGSKSLELIDSLELPYFKSVAEEMSFEKTGVSFILESKDYDTELITISPLEICGNGKCDGTETSDSCCRDCGCSGSLSCVQDSCIEVKEEEIPAVDVEEDVPCADDDDICPEGCTQEEDNDCGFCRTVEDCEDGLACTIDRCEGDPKACIRETKKGCESDGECVPQGDVSKTKYCDTDNVLKDKKEFGDTCDLDYECVSDFCGDGICQNLNIFTRFLDWLASLFG